MNYLLAVLSFSTLSCCSHVYPQAHFKVGWMTRVVAGIHVGQEFLIQDRQYEPSCVDGVAYGGELQNQYKELATICQEDLVATDD